MRIMIDTNVLISALLFPNSIPSKAIEKVLNGNRLVICSYVIEELHEVFNRKFKDRPQASLEIFLMKMSFEMVYSPNEIISSNYPEIRDINDLPVLVSAINEEVDILITGDKDFRNINVEKPVILTPSEFLSLEIL
jgi:putative PIN family toxin of toxin-antitoxin system